jgi:hypothetical protein
MAGKGCLEATAKKTNSNIRVLSVENRKKIITRE